MSVGCRTITWGRVAGNPRGITSVKDLYYLSLGSDERALREIAAAGYDGFEIFDGNLHRHADDPAPLQGWLRETGLQLVAVYAGANFVYADSLENELWRIRRAAEAGQRWGARFLNLGGGAIRAAGIRNADFEALARGLDRAAEIARAHDLLATYHPHLGTLSQSPDGLERLLRHTDIALCIDVAHVRAGGGAPLEVIRRYRDRIRYVHLKDWGAGRFLPLGEGEVDLKGVVQALGGSHAGTWWT